MGRGCYSHGHAIKVWVVDLSHVCRDVGRGLTTLNKSKLRQVYTVIESSHKICFNAAVSTSVELKTNTKKLLYFCGNLVHAGYQIYNCFVII